MKNKEAKSIFSPLENFSSVPPPELWDNIEKELDQPKKKKKSSFWWYAAAVFSIGLMLPLWMHFNSGSIDGSDINVGGNGVVLDTKSKSNPSNQNAIHPAETNNKVSVNSLEEKSSKGNDLGKSDTQSIANSNKSPKVGRGTSGGIHQSKPTTNDRIAVVSEEKVAVSSNNTIGVVSQVGGNKTSWGSKINSNLAEDIGRRGKIAVLATDKSKSASGENLLKTESNYSKSVQSQENEEVSRDKNNADSQSQAIAQKTSDKDSFVIQKEVAQLENKLKGLDEDKTDKKTNSDPIDKWSVQVFAGVMSSENYNNEKIAGNAIASSQSTGYGVKTNYKLNKKWSVSSGFKINELGQKMEGVSYYDQLNMGNSGYFALQSTADKSNVMPIAMKENSSLVLLSKSNNNDTAAAAAVNNFYETGNFAQNLRYFEMPLEVSYSVWEKKKTSISMNTGGFVGKLISNEVLLNGNSIGESLNVNEYVYGTMLTSTFQYEFLKKTKLFIEPGMNYYINPLENQSFNQFQWMFNFGINVNF